MIQVHPAAVVEEGAHLSDGCIIRAHAVITRYCDLAADVIVHPGAVLGGEPQDLRFDPATPSRVSIGARTVVREHVTVNRATRPGGVTTVGSDCYLMTGCHVAHDGTVGNHVVIANAVLLGGHVHVGDRAFLGGGAVVHQFCRIGESVMMGGGARISSDIPPYCLATERNTLIGLNLVGLRRRGFARATLIEIRRAFQALDVPFGNRRALAAACLASSEFTTPEARNFLEFFCGGRRTFVRTRRAAKYAAQGAAAPGDSADL